MATITSNGHWKPTQVKKGKIEKRKKENKETLERKNIFYILAQPGWSGRGGKEKYLPSFQTGDK